MFVALFLYFMDFMIDYNACPFNVFMTLPCYAYALMGYSYMMNWYVFSSLLMLCYLASR